MADGHVMPVYLFSLTNISFTCLLWPEFWVNIEGKQIPFLQEGGKRKEQEKAY